MNRLAIPEVVPWARLVVVASMLGDAWYLHGLPDTQTAVQIGAGTVWGVAFLAGALCLLATVVMPPGRWRALVAAVPIMVQISRAYETWTALDLPIYAGGVTVRVALAAMMLGALGWSPDAKHRVANRSRA